MKRKMLCSLALTGAAFAAARAPASQPVVPRPPNFVTCEEWHSTPDRIPDSKKQTPSWITIHHAGELWKAGTDPVKFLQNMQAWGKKRPQLEKPPRNTYWPDLPYHFLVSPDGRIFEGRPTQYEPESNTKIPLAGNLAIEVMGDFDKQRPSVAQLASLTRLVAWLMQEHKIALDRVRTHKDAVPTACPGRDLYRYFQDGSFKRWVSEVLAGKQLVIEPGPALKDGPTTQVGAH